MIGRIKSVYPDHIFIAEESYCGDGSFNIVDDPTWYIDPVDGTTNFVHGFSFTCISIAFAVNKETLVSVVYNPVMNELFTAIKGRGSFLNLETQLAVSSTKSINTALVGTEFGYDRSESGVAAFLKSITSILHSKVHGIRSAGSCALNMCYVAAGRFDLYYEGTSSKIGPKPWDMAAGRLIVKEAGGICADPKYKGSDLDMTSGRVLSCCNQTLLDEFYTCVVNYMD